MMASEELISGVIELAKRFNTGLTLHLAEYQGEVDYVLIKHGKRPLEYMLECGLKDITSDLLPVLKGEAFRL